MDKGSVLLVQNFVQCILTPVVVVMVKLMEIFVWPTLLELVSDQQVNAPVKEETRNLVYQIHNALGMNIASKGFLLVLIASPLLLKDYVLPSQNFVHKNIDPFLLATDTLMRTLVLLR